MSEVQVLQKTKIVPNGRNRGSTGALKIDRIRVAAYCRVSTDDDEQLGSFESQKLYYEQKIASNKDWVNAGIFADEAVTGTKTDKRSGFQDMIAHCHNGEIDMILTKSISRFARNTVTTDPISKRRLANMGEENQYYLRDHHEPIVSREIWDKAEEIRMKRSRNKVVETTGNRERYTRQYSFSSMCECAYCGHKLTRRTRHSRSDYEKPVWQCMNATKNGIANCPNCKAVDEAILEGAFLDAFGLLAGNFDDVLDVVLSYVAESADSDENMRKKQQIDKDISSLESKKSRMTDMLIDGTISKEVYEEKMVDFTRKLHKLSERKALLEDSICTQKDINRRMSELRDTLEKEQVLDEFDRVVFESIIDRVIVGGYEEDGTPHPYKLTFVLKGNQTGTVPHAKEQFKEKAKKSNEEKRVS